MDSIHARPDYREIQRAEARSDSDLCWHWQSLTWWCVAELQTVKLRNGKALAQLDQEQLGEKQYGGTQSPSWQGNCRGLDYRLAVGAPREVDVDIVRVEEFTLAFTTVAT